MILEAVVIVVYVTRILSIDGLEDLVYLQTRASGRRDGQGFGQG